MTLLRATCTTCDGTRYQTCHACRGRGKRVQTCNLGHEHEEPCPVCPRDTPGEVLCRGCGGRWYTERVNQGERR